VEVDVSYKPPLDVLDEVLHPARHAARLAKEFSGLSYARTIAEEMGVASARDLIAQQRFGLTESTLSELRELAEGPAITAYAQQMHGATDLALRQLNELPLDSITEQMNRATASAVLIDLAQAPAYAEEMRSAAALASSWIDATSMTSLMRDVGGLTGFELDAASIARLTDPFAQMKALATELEPLGQLIERYAQLDPFQDTIERIQREWDAARRGLFGSDFIVRALEHDEQELDADEEEETGVDALARVLDPDEDDTSPVATPDRVPEFVVAARFLSGVALVRTRTAQLAARFDARVASAPEALSDWLLVICGNVPAYGGRIGVLSCRVLHGVWLWNACLRESTGETAAGSRECLTVTDAEQFDEAVRALVALLDEIEVVLRS
jgi:hypothetical protein